MSYGANPINETRYFPFPRGNFCAVPVLPPIEYPSTFAPYDNPQVLIYVVVNEPNVADQPHSVFAQNIAREILEEVLPYMNIYPDEKKTGVNKGYDVTGSKDSSQYTGKHKIDQTPAQNHRHQNNRKEYDTYFSAVIGFIPLHEKHHDPFLKAYALQSLSKNSLSLVLLFLFISGLGSVMLFEGKYYETQAKDLQQRERKIKAARGKILDRNGVVLADNKSVCTISVIQTR